MKRERKAVWMAFPRRRMPEVLHPPLLVTLTRLKPSGGPLDDDNLRHALKAVRDQVAKELGIDDGRRDLIRFDYAEDVGEWGVRVDIAEVTP